MMMRAVVMIAGMASGLAACERPAEPVASTPAPPVAAVAMTPTPPATALPVAALSAADARRVCRGGLAAIYGQDPAAVEVTGSAGGVIAARWRAPVDGGRQTAECRIEADRILWRPLDLPEPDQVRWMDRPTDPRVTYVLSGETVAVTQTLADGTTDRVVLSVPAIREAV